MNADSLSETAKIDVFIKCLAHALFDIITLYHKSTPNATKFLFCCVRQIEKKKRGNPPTFLTSVRRTIGKSSSTSQKRQQNQRFVALAASRANPYCSSTSCKPNIPHRREKVKHYDHARAVRGFSVEAASRPWRKSSS